MGTSRIIFKSSTWWRRTPQSKTSKWHFDQLHSVDDVEDWIFNDRESYITPRLFLARNISSYTRGFTRADTLTLKRLAHERVNQAVGSA